MISLICFIVSALLFLLAGSNQDIFSQGELDEIGWAGFFLVLGLIFNGVWRPPPWRQSG